MQYQGYSEACCPCHQNQEAREAKEGGNEAGLIERFGTLYAFKVSKIVFVSLDRRDASVFTGA